MASRPKVKKSLKRRLIQESAGKCANPGCPRTLVELHHIQEWHVCFAHDEEHMIAICPSCHDSVTRGVLRVSEENAYDWKAITRKNDASLRGHLYVETSDVAPRLLLGTIAAQGSTGLVVFSDSDTRRLAFRTNKMDLMNLDATISSVDGEMLARVEDGHFEALSGSACQVAQRTGHFRITHPQTDAIIPAWVVRQMRVNEPTFASDGQVTLLEMEVLRPNLVRVEGLWLGINGGMVVTKSALSFVAPHLIRPLSLIGEGDKSVIQYVGSVERALFEHAGFS